MTLSSQVSRAELLRALQECQNDKQELAKVSGLLGYNAADKEVRPRREADQLEKEAKQGSGETTKKTATLLNPPPARAQVTYYYLAYRERYASEEVANQEQPTCFDGVATLAESDHMDYWPAQPALTPKSLVQANHMTPSIRRNLRLEVGKRLDVKKLVKQVAKQQPLRVIPTYSRQLPAGRVTVIADLNQRLVPFWEDIDEACQLIKQKHGKIGLDIRVLAKDVPSQDYYDYEAWQQRKLTAKPWEKIPAQSVVFIISDLGQLASENSLIRKRWLSFVQKLNRRGIRPYVLTPIAPENQVAAFQSSTQQLLWQRFGRLKTQKARGDSETHQQNVERVLSFLSLSPHIEPALLRAFCELLPYNQGNTGIEADVYLHPHVQFGLTSIAIRSEQREHYQQCFKALDDNLKQAVFDCVQRHHSAQFASVWIETIINAQPLMTVDPELVKQAEDWMLSFAKYYYSEASDDGMMRFSRRHLARLSREQQTAKKYASTLHGLAYRAEIQQGQAIPEHLDAALINQVIRQRSDVQTYSVRQIGERCVISADPQALFEQRGQYGQVLATFSTVQNTVLINNESMVLPIESLLLGNVLHINTGQERLTIRPLKKPSWASSIAMQASMPVATLILAGEPTSFGLHPSYEFEGNGDWVLDMPGGAYG